MCGPLPDPVWDNPEPPSDLLLQQWKETSSDHWDSCMVSNSHVQLELHLLSLTRSVVLADWTDAPVEAKQEEVNRFPYLSVATVALRS